MRVPRPLGTRLHCSLPCATSPLTEPQIWNHPDVLYEALQKENLANEQDLDVEELGSAGTSARCPSQGTKGKGEDSALASAMGEATNSKFLQGVGFSPFQERGNNIVTYEWVSEADASVVIPLLRRGVEGMRGDWPCLSAHLSVKESREGSQVLGDLLQIKGEKKAPVALGREGGGKKGEVCFLSPLRRKSHEPSI